MVKAWLEIKPGPRPSKAGQQPQYALPNPQPDVPDARAAAKPPGSSAMNALEFVEWCKASGGKFPGVGMVPAKGT